MRKISNFVLIAAFASLILFLPAAGGLHHAVTGGSGSSENRQLAPFPELAAVWDLETFPVRFSAWYEDRMPLKEKLVRLKSETEWALFHELDSDRVISGTRKPWLFYRANDGQPLETYKRTNLFSEQELGDICGNLQSLQSDLAGENIGLVLLIVPDKEQIYGERFMPQNIRVQENEGRTGQLIHYLSENAPKLQVVYPLEILKKAAAEDEIYYPSDTHWNLHGASIGSAALAKRIAALYDTECKLPAHSFKDAGRKTGDLQKLVMIGNSWDSVEWETGEEMQFTVTGQLSDKNGETIEESAVSDYSGAIPCRIYLTGDSFRWNLTPFVEESFAESVVSSRYYFDTEKLLTSRPDVLVYEIAERYLHELTMIPGYNTMALQVEAVSDGTVQEAVFPEER